MKTVLVALLAISVSVSAREVHVLFFSFAIPDSWLFEGKGGATLFATGGTKAYGPPSLLAQACIAPPKGPCRGFPQPDQMKDGDKFCPDFVFKAIPRTDRIVETRWICSPVKLIDGVVTNGTIVFEIDGTTLKVSYIAGPEDPVPSAFLDELARSLKVEGP